MPIDLRTGPTGLEILLQDQWYTVERVVGVYPDNILLQVKEIGGAQQSFRVLIDTQEPTD